MKPHSRVFPSYWDACHVTFWSSFWPFNFLSHNAGTIQKYYAVGNGSDRKGSSVSASLEGTCRAEWAPQPWAAPSLEGAVLCAPPPPEGAGGPQPQVRGDPGWAPASSSGLVPTRPHPTSTKRPSVLRTRGGGRSSSTADHQNHQTHLPHFHTCIYLFKLLSLSFF